MSVDASKFPPLSVTGIGLVDGLLGVNCRHSIGPGDGRFNPYEGLYDSEENRKREELDKKQRAMERKIRATKREVQGLKAALDAATDPADRAELQAAYQEKAAKLTEQNKAYDAFCKETGQKPLRERLQIAGWDRKQAAQAAAAGRAAERAVSEESLAAPIRAAIRRGDHNLTILAGKQAEHMEGTAKPGKSVITISMEELQALVKEKAGTGRLRFGKDGKWDNKEIIDAGRIIGYTLNREGVIIQTRRAKIHYRNTGVHVVPYSGS